MAGAYDSMLSAPPTELPESVQELRRVVGWLPVRVTAEDSLPAVYGGSKVTSFLAD